MESMQGPGAPHGRAFRPTVMGRRGCVAAAHPLASMAGIEVLLQGGSAIDAALATSFALHVVEPYMSGPGGVATLLVFHRGRREAVVSAGQMPGAADPGRVTAEDLKAGPRSIGVPGLVAATVGLHERYGKMPRIAVMAPAIRLAEDRSKVLVTIELAARAGGVAIRLPMCWRIRGTSQPTSEMNSSRYTAENQGEA